MCGFGALIHDSAVAVDIKPTRCRSWTCDECAPLRRAQCEIIARRGRPNKFLTLTCNPRIGVSPLDRMGRMKKKLPLLIRRMERFTGKRIPYFWTTEKTKAGEPHIHMLLRADFVPHKCISKWWNELTGAFIVYIEAVENKKKAAKYVSKYLNKSLEKFGNFKRYSKTRDYELPPEETESVHEWQPVEWKHSPDDAEDIEHSYRVRGYWRVPGELRGGIRTLWPLWRYARAFSQGAQWRGG